MDFTEKTIQRDIKYSGRIFTVTQDIVELPNGKTSTRDLVFHTGAVAVLVIRDGKMLLVRQYRSHQNAFLRIPAGKLDSKEEVPLEAAKRELEEETNLVASEMGEDKWKWSQRLDSATRKSHYSKQKCDGQGRCKTCR